MDSIAKSDAPENKFNPCSSCNRPVRAHLKGFEGFCYSCGTDLDMHGKSEALKDALEQLELDRAVAAVWRAHV